MTFWRGVGLAMLVLVPVVVTAIVLQDFVREVLIGPVLYTYWVIRLFLESIPQIWIWIAFVVLVAYGVARSLASLPTLPRRRPVKPVKRGPVAELAWLLRQSDGGDRYARWRLAQLLGGLAGDVLADTERVSRREIWRRIERGHLDIPQPIQAYLTARLRSIRPSGRSGFRPAPSPLDLDPREVVTFLEEQIKRDWSAP